MDNKNRAISFLKFIIENKIKEAYEKFVSSNFIHHDPHFKGTREALFTAMKENAEESPTKEIDIKYALEESDKIAVFSHIKQSPSEIGMAAVHLFRFKDQKIIEMWSIHQSIPEHIVNEYGMF
jgi:predicted SnoaL-like aldol condensation-catalyzing enzyme